MVGECLLIGTMRLPWHLGALSPVTNFLLFALRWLLFQTCASFPVAREVSPRDKGL
ncbi:hypothetical protein BH11ARM2_BH11ARM2_30260 [soil metagenome]